MTDLEASVQGERIIWRGKPKFNVFILETIFNPMLFFALIWGAIDFGIIGVFLSQEKDEMGSAAAFLIPFFLFHLMPVWIYLGGIITSVIKYKHTEYIITERGIYISGGIIALNVQMKPFTDLSHVNIHKGILDQILGVGDVNMVCAHTGGYDAGYGYNYGRHNHGHAHQAFNIVDIADYQEVFKIIKDMQTDIYADTMYPNAMRPEENPGYGTKYTRF